MTTTTDMPDATDEDSYLDTGSVDQNRSTDDDQMAKLSNDRENNLDTACEEDFPHLDFSSSTARFIVRTHSYDIARYRSVSLSSRALCELCRHAFEAAADHSRSRQSSGSPDEFLPEDFRYAHHGSLAELEACAADYCALCQFFLATMTDEIRLAFTRDDRHYLFIGFWIDRTHHDSAPLGMAITDISLKLQDNEGFQDISLGDIWYELRNCGEMNPYFYSRPNRQSPSIAVGRKWIADCLCNHDDCENVRHDYEMPTRLLDIGQSPGISLRLVPSSSIDAQVFTGYVALSHCWGSRAPESRTQISNLEARRSAFDFESLEQTFRDAVLVTRGLGYRYLWVDSLCIVQDDKQDWEIECSRMETVVSNAVVVIVSLDTEDAYDGFLQKRSPMASSSQCGVSLRGQRIDFGDIIIQLAPNIKKPNLQTRAWTLQEQFLARRLLYFSKSQMFFWCSKGFQYEATLYPHQPSPGLQQMSDIVPQQWRTTTSSVDNDLLRFYKVVEMYAMRSLSFEKDRLPALTGIVRRYFQNTPDEYLAGLWRRYLLLGLAWHTNEGEREGKSDTATYTAPSWSWASLKESPLSYGSLFRWFSGEKVTYHPLANVVNAWTQPKGHNVFGEVTGGEIQVLAWLITFEVGTELVPGSSHSFLLYYAGTREQQDMKEAIALWPDEGHEWYRQASGTSIVCMPLITAGDSLEQLWIGLALRSVEGEDETYIRIGLVQGASRDGSRWDEVLSEKQRGERKLLRLI